MNRLTSKNPLTEKEALNLSLTDLYMRLKLYEDTGLEPEEVAYFLGTTMSAKEAKAQYAEHKERYDEYMAWKEVESEGRLMILPCKVGTRVYIKYCQFIPVCCDRCISGHGFDSDCDYFEKSQEHCKMELQHDKFGRTMGIASKSFTYDMIPQFGKTVFLTREEAEEALKKESET